MKENAHKMNWLPDVLTALGSPANKLESSLPDLLAYIGQNEEYKATWEEGVRANGLILPVLDGVASKAIQSMCNMNKSQMKQLRSCLKVELGSTIFSLEYKITQVLGLEHVELTTGSYKYGKEPIDWSYKPVPKVLELWVKSHLGGPNSFQGVQGDHLDHSWITCNFLTHTQSKNRVWKEDEYVCTIGNGARRTMRLSSRISLVFC
jgi:hypothetical protein